MKRESINIEKCRSFVLSWYKNVTGKQLNLDEPETFNEKIQWLKLYNAIPIKTRLADKYLVRDWIKEKIGEQYLIPLLGVYERFEDINFDELPNKFVIKCNHGCGWNIIVDDKGKLDLDDAKKKIDEWLEKNFAFRSCELHYCNIPPRIVIEKYLDAISNSLYDYRFFCFNGKVEQIWLDIYSGTPEHKRKIYDRNWQELNVTVHWPKIEEDVPKPSNLDKMIELSEKLSDGFALVRVDLYRMDDGTIYFGEMTFTSMSGTGPFQPPSEDKRLGDLLQLPEQAYDVDTGVYYNEPEQRFYKNQIDYVIENKLASFGEKQIQDVETKLAAHDKQLSQGIETTTEKKLDAHSKQLAQSIESSLDKKLGAQGKTIVREIETITDNKLNIQSKQLSQCIEAFVKRELDAYSKQLTQEAEKKLETHGQQLTHELETILDKKLNAYGKAITQECTMLRRELKQNHEKTRRILRDLSQYGRYKRLYRWYKLLRYITFGKRRKHYKEKVNTLKLHLREIRYFIKSA